MNNKKAFTIFCGVLVLLALSHIKDIYQNWDAIGTGFVSEERQLQRKAREENICIINDLQGIRDRQYSYHAIGNEYVFFSYSVGSFVDAYDHNGIYQFTIIVPDSQNGTVSIRCDGDLLYISSKQDLIYIFDGTEQVDCLTDEESELAGYDWRWFNDQPGLEKDKNYIYLKDENGNIVLQATIPNAVKYA